MNLKLTKENATKEFQKIVEYFGFYVPHEVKTQKIETVSGGMTLSLQQDIDQAASFIQKIMEGTICFNEKDGKIIYKLLRPIKIGDGGAVVTKEFSFGEYTMGKQKQTKIALKDCNMANMSDDQRYKVIQAMTGVSDDTILDKLSIPMFNDLWMIAGYFFS